MAQKKLIWQIFPANLLILSITVISAAWFGKVSLDSFYLSALEKDLVARAYIAKPAIVEMVENKDIDALRQHVRITGRQSQTRFTVVLPQGKVIADTNENPETMELHHNRIEIAAALTSDVGTSLRYSRTLGQEMLYVAIALYHIDSSTGSDLQGSENIAVLRLSVPVTSIEIALKRLSTRILFGILAFVVLAAIASLIVSRNTSKPLEKMEEIADRFSKGDFELRMSALLGNSASLEVATLAASMDKMADELKARIKTIESQRYELETVFSSMVEAVIAVDGDEKIININEAAAKLLGVNKENAKGRIVQEVVRNFDLHQQLSLVLSTGESIEDEIIHRHNDKKRYLQTNFVSLKNKKHEVLGVLVVLNDVTRLRSLESIRRDFVANVSHELRTPITSIRGYVETLLDGTLMDKEESRKFLEIVFRQADRLSEIINDLLALSKIEEEADNNQITLQSGNLLMVLEAALESCRYKAEQEEVTLTLHCPETLMAQINDTLIEQAIGNLLVNGIAYSHTGGEVEVIADAIESENGNHIKIDVIDTGIGIPAQHLPRLFERFYRIDKARSRKHGGTGLGLAIVKHIIQAHNGEIEVTSKEGQGTVFTISLPGV